MFSIPPSLIRSLLVLVCLIGSAVLVQAEEVKRYEGPKEKLHLYLLIGQSNMAGRAPLGEELKGVIDRCYLLNAGNEWEPAKNPLNRYSTIRKGLGMQKLGPGDSFARTMLKENKDISLGLVVNAKGGSSIKQWSKESAFYKDAVKRMTVARKSGVLKGILWHQGESDAKDAEYLDKLSALVENLRKDFGMSDLPFVAGQVNNLPLINNQISRLPERVDGTGFVSSKGLKVMDRWHFDAASMKLLGERYAGEMQKVQAGREN
jgi:hypothetical protein